MILYFVMAAFAFFLAWAFDSVGLSGRNSIAIGLINLTMALMILAGELCSK